MSIVIPQGTTVAGKRTLTVFVADATTFAAKTSGVAGQPAKIKFGAGTYVDSDNDLAAKGVDGWYGLELSDDETENDVGPAHMAISISGCAPAGKDFQIGPSTVGTPSPSEESIANAVNDMAAVRALGIKRTGTNGNGGISIPLTSGTATGTLATDVRALPVTEFDTES